MRKPIPFEFVLDELSALDPYTKPMFGCTAIYVDQKIVLILRERPQHLRDNGVWIATTIDHHESLKKDLPSMRTIEVFETRGPSGWQIIPMDSETFEEEVLKACELIKKDDPRIGKIPKPKKIKSKTKKR
jgi:hypothetical protein